MDYLSVENLSVHYGVIRALTNVSFTVREGEIVTLIGANGAGKSTIMKALMNAIPKSGNVHFNGTDISSMETHNIVKCGMTGVPEGRHIFNELTVEENLKLGGYLEKGSLRESMDEVFSRFPRLKERKKQIAGTLSGGEQQMLAMGRAIMTHPKLLLLDEPSMGLSPLLVNEVFRIIQSFHEEGMTILLVEQNAGKSLAVSDRAYVLENGKITLTGTGNELLQSEEVQKSYLGG